MAPGDRVVARRVLGEGAAPHELLEVVSLHGAGRYYVAATALPRRSRIVASPTQERYHDALIPRRWY
jgi:hypothetical protein